EDLHAYLPFACESPDEPGRRTLPDRWRQSIAGRALAGRYRAGGRVYALARAVARAVVDAGGEHRQGARENDGPDDRSLGHGCFLRERWICFPLTPGFADEPHRQGVAAAVSACYY